MYSKSNTPDTIGVNLKELAKLIITENNLFKKSKENDSLGEHLPDIIVTTKGREYLGGQLFKSFDELRADFNTDKINQVRYVERLKEFNDFFTISDIQKSDIPNSLNAPEIMIEIARWI